MGIVERLEEGGATALGPALCVALGALFDIVSPKILLELLFLTFSLRQGCAQAQLARRLSFVLMELQMLDWVLLKTGRFLSLPFSLRDFFFSKTTPPAELLLVCRSCEFL
jgi:hypothetical protein